MVVGAFPVIKLGFLLIRQISKPLANYMISQAKTSPTFRTYVCMPPAQFYNWCEVKTKMWILNLGKPVNIPVLNEAMAIELGANLLGESIIYGVGAALAILEYNRSSRKEAAKEAAKEAEMKSMTNRLKEMFLEVEEQRTQIRELTRLIAELDGLVIKKPHWSKKDEPTKDPKDEPPSGTSGSPKLSIEPKELVTQKDKSASKMSSFLLRAVEIVENDYLKNPNQKRELGILPLAINHLYQDVYRISISMY